MFGNCTQSVYREEGQSSHNEDNDKRHYSESQRISLQCSGTLGNELLLSQQAGNGNLSDNRQESAQSRPWKKTQRLRLTSILKNCITTW